MMKHATISEWGVYSNIFGYPYISGDCRGEYQLSEKEGIPYPPPRNKEKTFSPENSSTNQLLVHESKQQKTHIYWL